MHVPLTTLDFIERAEAAYGRSAAVIDEPGIAGELGELTYSALAARARGFAAALDELGIAAGARVAIVSPNCARFMVALYGATMTGRILVPVNFRLKPQEVRFILEHSGAELLLVDPELDEALGELPVAAARRARRRRRRESVPAATDRRRTGSPTRTRSRRSTTRRARPQTPRA